MPLLERFLEIPESTNLSEAGIQNRIDPWWMKLGVKDTGMFHTLLLISNTVATQALKCSNIRTIQYSIMEICSAINFLKIWDFTESTLSKKGTDSMMLWKIIVLSFLWLQFNV